MFFHSGTHDGGLLLQKFTDNQRREWTVCITPEAVARIREATGKDLARAASGRDVRPLFDLVGDIVADVPLLLRVLFQVCSEQAAARGITEDQFTDGTAGAWMQCARAFTLAACIDFPVWETRRGRELARRKLEKAYRTVRPWR